MRPNEKMSDMDFALMKPHLMRMKKSANFFDFKFGSQFARRSMFKAVKAHEQKTQSQGTLRVRLLLNENGAMKIECFPITLDPADKIISFTISNKIVQSDDVFLKHKTTNRALYDEEHAHYNKSLGCDEVLFLNEREELSEGSRSNVFILPKGAEEGDILLTPPVSSGLLPGLLRDKMLKTKKAQEQILKTEDLQNAEKIYFGNSVRGLQEAQICEK